MLISQQLQAYLLRGKRHLSLIKRGGQILKPC